MQWDAARSVPLTSGRPPATGPLARPTELHSKTPRPSSNENGLGDARCAPAYSLDTPVRAPAPEIFAPTVHKPPPACAFPVLRADAPHCIPGGSGPTHVAVCAGWLRAALPPLVSACDACVHVFHSAPDAPLRCAPARCPA